MTRIEPNRLNTRCARAVRFELILVDVAARFDVIVVPMFSPRMNATAFGKVITPHARSNIVILVAAADDCRQKVITAPMIMNSTVLRPISVIGARKLRTPSLESSG